MTNKDLYNKILNIFLARELYEKAAILRDTYTEKNTIVLKDIECQEIEWFWLCGLNDFGEWEVDDDL